MWRSTGDIQDNWASIKQIHYEQMEYQPYNGVGCFNDMDMLVVGMFGKGNAALGGCTLTEYRTHFSLWCMLNSPLMLGCDIRNMSDDVKKIITNKEIIAINQDPAGRQPMLLQGFRNGVHEQFFIWAKHLEGGDIAIGVFNLLDHDEKVFVGYDALGLGHCTNTVLKFRDVWNDREWIYRDGIKAIVPAHDCYVWRCKVLPFEK